jgi:uncharacterized protein YcfL
MKTTYIISLAALLLMNCVSCKVSKQQTQVNIVGKDTVLFEPANTVEYIRIDNDQEKLLMRDSLLQDSLKRK